MQTGLFQDVSPPVHGEIYTFAHSTTAARYEVPPDWNGQYVTICANTSTLYCAFGDAGVKVGAGEYATVTGETLTPNMACGFIVPAGGLCSVPVADNCTHFSVDSDAASGDWCVYRSSGSPVMEERLPANLASPPILWLDAALRRTVDATTVGSWRGRHSGTLAATFSEASNKPALLDAAAVGSGVNRPAVGFTAGSSHKLISTDAALAAALGGTNAFTLYIAARRTATTANHTLFSVGTAGSNNGRWDVTLDSSDDFKVTRVDTAGSSTASTYATTLSAGFYLFTLVFDGATPTYYQDRTVQTLSGTAAGDVGTTTKVAIGCRAYNTSTADQFASAEIAEVIAFSGAQSAGDIARMHAWLKRRHGK